MGITQQFCIDTMKETPSPGNEVSAFSSPKDVEDVQQKIDEEIRVFEKNIRDLKTRRNSLSLIARLPPEILATIFKCLEAAQADKIFGRWEWISLSHVCSHWRRVALECPSLWTRLRLDIHSSNREWVEEMLERSKSAPLTLDAEITPSSKGVVLSVLTNVDRIQILSLYSRIQLDQEILNVLKTCPASLLEQFEMSFGTAGDARNHLPNNLFSGHLPLLRELKLINCTISWESSILNRLTSLTISHPSSTAIRYPTMEQLMSTLGNMPSLTTLDLSGVIPSPPADNEANHASQTITLPHLSNIAIKSSVPSCVYFLRRLSFPATSSINVYSSEKTNFTDFLAIFRTIFSTDDRSSVRQAIRCLKISYGGFYGGFSDAFLFKTWNTIGSNGGEPIAEPQCAINLETAGDFAKSWDEAEAEFWGILPLNTLESLQLLGSDIPKETWLKLCGRLDQLVTLSVSGFSGNGLLKVLSLSQTEKSDEHIQHVSPLYFPALRELSISGWDFSDGPEASEHLKRCLKERHEAGAGIQKLYLRACHCLYQNDVTELEDVIPDVCWDKVEEVTDDFEDEYDYEDEDEYGYGYEDANDFDYSDYDYDPY